MTVQFSSWIGFIHSRVQQNLKWIVEEDYVSTYRCDNTATYHESFEKYRHFVIDFRNASGLLPTKKISQVEVAEFLSAENAVENEKDLGGWFKFGTIGKRKDPPGEHNIRLDKKMHCPRTVHQVIVCHSVFVISVFHGIRIFKQDEHQTSKCYFQSQGCLIFSYVQKRIIYRKDVAESCNKLSDSSFKLSSYIWCQAQLNKMICLRMESQEIYQKVKSCSKRSSAIRTCKKNQALHDRN